MGRLIDVDDLLKAVEESNKNNPHKNPMVRLNHAKEHEHFMHLINNQPTAYDVDKVIARLETMRNKHKELAELWYKAGGKKGSPTGYQEMCLAGCYKMAAKIVQAYLKTDEHNKQRQ